MRWCIVQPMRIGMRLVHTLCALALAAGPVDAAAKKTTSNAAAAKRSRAAQMRERGLAAVAAGREDEALEDFGLAVEADPNDQFRCIIRPCASTWICVV